MKNSSTPSQLCVIFDMDGLMLNTEHLGLSAWTEAVKSLGYDLPEEVFMQMIGCNRVAALKVLSDYFGPEFPVEEAFSRRREIGQAPESQMAIRTQPGLLELLNYLKENKISCCVATSTDYDVAVTRLQRVGVIEFFDDIVTGDMVVKSKPHPDIFLEAIRRLNAKSERTVILEDSENGIRAAHAAGAIPIMVPDLKQPSDEVSSLAYKICRDLYEAMETIKSDFLD